MVDSRAIWQDRFKSLDKIFAETETLHLSIAAEYENIFQTFFPNWDPNQPNANAFNDKAQAYDLLLLSTQIDLSLKLLHSLRIFITQAFNTFLEQYDESDRDADDAFKQRFIMRFLLFQGSLDLNIIQQLVHQRHYIVENNTPKLSFQNKNLLLADGLATMALSPLINAGYLPTTTNVMCYLEKNVRIRLVPYDDTVLIRIAATSFWKRGGETPSEDLLAILHEIGHHLYWNGKVPGSAQYIYQLLADKMKMVGIHNPKDWRRRWLEEIFADAYALLQGGPVVVYNFQEMLAEDLPNHFKEDVDKHPIPEIRPLIQAKLLGKYQNDSGNPLYSAIHDQLDQAWQETIGKDPLQQTYHIHHHHEPMTGQEILQTLDGLLDKIAEVLQPLYSAIISNEDAFTRQPGIWSKDSVKNNELHALYTQFAHAATAKHIQKETIWGTFFANTETAHLEIAAIGETDDAILRFLSERFSSTPKTFDERVEELTGKKPSEHTDDDWIDIFLSRGWSTEGPDADPTGH